MHPQYRSDKPGDAPCCGMRLEPVYADGGGSTLKDQAGPAPDGTLRVSPEKQQLIGVRTEVVSSGSASHAVRVSGRVALDETRIFRVATAVDGWVRKAGPIVSGSMVRKDEVLATFYNRDFLTAQQTYLYALNTMDRFKDKESEDQLKLTRAQMRAAEENLEFLGMGEIQIQEIARTRQIAREVELRAPVAGLVLARNAFPGLRFDRGTELFRIADVKHVWVLADLFGNEARFVKPGQTARIILPDQGRWLPGKFSDALPQFDAASRALKARLELDNPDYLLRPDMFVDVEFHVNLPAAVSVPADVVVDSGLRKSVYVDRGNGFFEPRTVETGWRLGGMVEITKGLAPGERIVVSGNFLIDSESRMKSSATGAAPAAAPEEALKDPVCGMRVSATADGRKKSIYRGRTFYFCSETCKQSFDKDPAQYAARQHD